MYYATGSPKIFSVCKSNIDIYSSASNDTNFQISEPSSLIQIKKNEECSLFATINKQTIYLWNIRPTVLLSSVSRSQKSIEEHGENKEIIWNGLSFSIVIITSKNYLYFYDVMSDKSHVYQYNFSTRHEYYNEENTGVPKTRIVYKFITEIDEEIKCGVEYDNNIILGTNKSIITIKWDGRIIKKDSIYELSFLGLTPKEENVYITHISKSKNYPFLAWILSNKSVFLVGKNQSSSKDGSSNSANPSNSWVGIQFNIDEKCTGDICITEFHPFYKMIALGTTTGDAIVYTVKEVNELPEFSHYLSFMKSSGIYSDIQLGRVSSLDWTDDGYAIAIGMLHSGFSVWSIYGRFLMSTITEDTISQSKEISDYIQDDYFAGVKGLFWGLNGYELYLLPTISLDKEYMEEIYVLQYVKHPLIHSLTQDNLHHIYLHSSNSIYFSVENDINSSNENFNPTQWQTIQIPEMYLSHNWPIRYSSIDSTGQYLAMAGKHGLIHYSFVTARWKLFGNVQHEQSVTCCGGLVWYKNIIIFACRNEETKKYEIRYYNRDLNLDNSKLLFVEHIAEVIYMDILENNLLVYTINNKVNHFVLDYDRKNNKLKVTYFSELSIAEFVENPRDVKSLSWYPVKLSKPDPKELLMCPILMIYKGEFKIIVREVERMYIHHLAKNIEYYWTSMGWDVEVGKLYNSLWLFDGKEIKMWVNILLPKEMNSLWKHELYAPLNTPSFTFTVDFCPLLVLLYKGIIMGVSQSLSLKCSMEIVYFKPDKKSHLFLPYFIKYLLSNNLYDEAVRFVDCFQNLEYFGHALELLLHYVLEEEVENRKHGGKGELLSLVIKFIKNYNQYFDIIVQCARKTEVLVWEYFFSIVGDPKILFKQCISDGRLRTATSYLIIIQTLEPLEVSEKMAVDLLEKAFEMEDYNLCQELIRFLSTINDSGYVLFSKYIKNSDSTENLPIENLNINENETMNEETSNQQENINNNDENGNKIENEIENENENENDDEYSEDKKIMELNKLGEKKEKQSKSIIESDLIHIEDLIIKQTFSLLSQNKIRSVGKIARLLGFPLKEWLIEERSENNKFEIENWNEAFISLHEQFKWPLPDDIISVKNYIQDYIENILIIEREEENSNTTEDNDRQNESKNFIKKRGNSSNIHIPITNRSVHNEIDEINFLIHIFQELKMNDWVLLLASLSFNIQAIINTLLSSENQTILLENLKEALLNSKGKGYPPLYSAINDILEKEEQRRKKKEDEEEE